MYTRTYFTDDKKIDIPDNYDGNAFEKSTPVLEAASIQPTENVRSDQAEKEETEPEDIAASVGTSAASLFGAIPFKRIFSSAPLSYLKGKIFTNKSVKFGSEEILISLIALYLFFSDSGDKECAIMLAILLFL